jgi:hypothetical protein
MIEAVGLFQAINEPNSPSAGDSSQSPDLSDVSLERPTESQAADFARATANLPIREVNAAPVPPAQETTNVVVHTFESLTSHPQTFKVDSDHFEGLPPQNKPTREEPDSNWLEHAIAQMDGAFAFATATTMAGRGATEATKILNTLLKGQ